MENQSEMKRLITEIVSVRKEVVHVQDEINNNHLLLTNLIKELQTICPHKELKVKEEYFSGGYLYRSKNVTTHTCIVCDFVVSEEVETGSYE